MPQPMRQGLATPVFSWGVRSTAIQTAFCETAKESGTSHRIMSGNYDLILAALQRYLMTIINDMGGCTSIEKGA